MRHNAALALTFLGQVIEACVVVAFPPVLLKIIPVGITQGIKTLITPWRLGFISVIPIIIALISEFIDRIFEIGQFPCNIIVLQLRFYWCAARNSRVNFVIELIKTLSKLNQPLSFAC